MVRTKLNSVLGLCVPLCYVSFARQRPHYWLSWILRRIEPLHGGRQATACYRWCSGAQPRVTNPPAVEALKEMAGWVRPGFELIDQQIPSEPQVGCVATGSRLSPPRRDLKAENVSRPSRYDTRLVMHKHNRGARRLHATLWGCMHQAKGCCVRNRAAGSFEAQTFILSSGDQTRRLDSMGTAHLYYAVAASL